MHLITDVMTPGLLALLYLLLALPWIVGTQSRVRSVLGPRTATLLIALRAVVLLVIMGMAAGLTVILPGAGGTPTLLVLTDRSLSMGLPLAEGAPETRREAAQRAVRSITGGLSDDWRFERRWFGSSIVGTGREDEVRTVEGTSDIVGSLEEAASSVDRIDQVLLVTDGRVTSGRTDADRLRGRIPPVHALLIGDTDISDVSIEGFRLPDPLYQDEAVPVQLVLLGLGPGGGETAVRAAVDGRNVETRTVAAKGNGMRSRVDFDLPPLAPGMHDIEVEIGVEGDDFTGRNDGRKVHVPVRRTRRSVVLVTNRPDWDLGFAVRDLGDREEYDAVLFLLGPGDRIGCLSGPDRFRSEAGELFRRDLGTANIIVLNGDIPGLPAFVKEAVSGRLETGAAGVLLMPTSPWKGRGSWGDLAPLCPYPGGAEVIPAGDGAISAAGPAPHPVIENGFGAGFDEWSEIPPLSSVITGVSPAGGFEQVLSASVRSDLDVPVVMARDAGWGREAVILGLGLWQWDLFPVQFGRGPYFRPLMGGILAWLSEPSFLGGAGCEPSSFSLRAGQPLTFTARTGREEAGGVDVTLTSGRTGDDFVLTFEPGGEAQESGPVYLPPGLYRYAAAPAGESGRGPSLGEGTVLIDSSSVEYDDPRPDPVFLERVGARTGGGMYTYPEVSSLVETLRERAKGAGRSVRFDLREEPAVPVLLLSLFFIELIVRRRRGLP